jgi:hypothetical protein
MVERGEEPRLHMLQLDELEQLGVTSSELQHCGGIIVPVNFAFERHTKRASSTLAAFRDGQRWSPWSTEK